MSSKLNPGNSGAPRHAEFRGGYSRERESACKGPGVVESRDRKLVGAKSYWVSWATLMSLEFIPGEKEARCNAEPTGSHDVFYTIVHNKEGWRGKNTERSTQGPRPVDLLLPSHQEV